MNDASPAQAARVPGAEAPAVDAPRPSARVTLAIVVLHYNGLEDTRRCLESLHSSRPLANVVLVDNASAEPAEPALGEAFPWVAHVRTPRNLGYAGGNNAGIAFALARGATHVVLLNNDTIVADDFAARLIEAIERNPAFDVLGPVIRFMDEPGQVMTEGVVFDRPGFPGFFESVPVDCAGAPVDAVEVDIVNGCCLLASRRVFERIGLIDPAYFLVHEESDFCLRAAAAGFRCAVVPQALVWHKGSSSFARTGKALQRYFDARNLLRLLWSHAGYGARRRGPLGSAVAYTRYMFHRYCAEMEAGQPASARAIARGIADACWGRWGAMPERPAPGTGAIDALFRIGRAITARRRERPPRGPSQSTT